MAAKRKKSKTEGSGLAFEKPLQDLEERIAELEALGEKTRLDLGDELEGLRTRLKDRLKEVFSDLTPWQRIAVARHPQRPKTTDYIHFFSDEEFELHGDGCFGDDEAIITSLVRSGDRAFLVVGHRKGHTTEGRVRCNFGMPHPEGYRKALRKMHLAERLGLPIVCLVNTPGAHPGLGAEERGQARSIAENIVAMFTIRVPILVLIIGEGGSGGALGIGVGDRVGMLEHSYYSVISPEGCAAILWNDSQMAPQAAESLKLTAADLLDLGIIDEVLPEPLGGAHRDLSMTMTTVRDWVLGQLDELCAVPVEQLLAERHEKFRRMGTPVS